MFRVFVLTSPLATCSCKATCLRCRSGCDGVCCYRGGVFLLVVAVRVFADEGYMAVDCWTGDGQIGM
jgi:hypothetical protein